MRHQAFQVRMRRLCQRLQNLVGRSARAQAAHAGIDLEMVAYALAGRLREAIHLRNLVERMDGGSEVEFRQGFAFMGQKAAHHQDASFDAAAAQGNAFFHRADRQPSRAFRDDGA